MANCNNCIHHDLCIDNLVRQFPTYKNRNIVNGDDCEHYKSTTDFVEVVRCKDCKQFMEYSDAYKRAVERADGDCFIKHTHSYDNQFIACRYNDFCSYGKRK